MPSVKRLIAILALLPALAIPADDSAAEELPFAAMASDNKLSSDTSRAEADETQEMLGSAAAVSPWEFEETSVFDNLRLDFGGSGAKQPTDLGLNGFLGLQAGLNWGHPLIEEWGLGMQLGSSLNYSKTMSIGGALLGPLVSSERFQVFATAGFFQRANSGWNWGVAYDFLSMKAFDESFDLGQWRGQLGYEVTTRDELGIWATTAGRDGRQRSLGITLKPATQGNLYWRHQWPSDCQTRVWVGIAEKSKVIDPFVLGGDFQVPLTNRVALFGQCNLILPRESGLAAAVIGITIFPGGNASRFSRRPFSPFLPVADNTSFVIDAML